MDNHFTLEGCSGALAEKEKGLPYEMTILEKKWAVEVEAIPKRFSTMGHSVYFYISQHNTCRGKLRPVYY